MHTNTSRSGRRFDLSALAVPVVAAPMAGGPSTPALAAAVGIAGGLGFLAAGYKTADAVRREIETIRDLTGASFGVNVFVPQPSIADPADLATYARSLEADAAALGTALGAPRHDDDDWSNTIDVLLELAPAVASFTFDLPERNALAALQHAGTAVVQTVTSRAEAGRAVAAGVDALVVQGPEAGGHRGTFDPLAEPGTASLLELLDDLRELGIPLIAAGGIVSGEDTREALARGAVAVQAGTAFLRADEAGTKPAHRAALATDDFGETALTRAFSGRYARALLNEFIRDHDADVPPAYPEVHHLTAPLRAAAAAADDPHRLNLWAGVNAHRTIAGSAAALVRSLLPSG
ncbi:nitronate monooxygenase [Arthrobacter echini]|uniref:Propionate 3-nitronate monooxygenase n=1 Tax=Arthrobacter echini TaxID=1529066 RepID=A0A5D0XWC6_9MICC|nr:nitronate monooxygenase [Arthrobacter echini]TYD00302.1 nitronate monooxygenase [Arthrobacter echini]